MEGVELAKQVAAWRAVDVHVQSGMTVGLGSGSTASYAVRHIADRVRSNELTDLRFVSTSEATSDLARSLGLVVQDIGEVPLPLDVTLDGADEVHQQTPGAALVLIKGRGGALVREKLVELHSKLFVCMADSSKVVTSETLGLTGAVPVEIVPFNAMATVATVLAASTKHSSADVTGHLRPASRHSQQPFVTDNGNLILDLHLTAPLVDVTGLHRELKLLPGVVDTGFFIAMASHCYVASPDGRVSVLADTMCSRSRPV